MNCGPGLGARIGGGGGRGGGVFASPGFRSFSGFNRFSNPFGVWPWNGWNYGWPWQSWYLYYPDYYPVAQQCAVGNIQLTEAQTRQLAAGQTIAITVTNTCGQLVTVTLHSGSAIQVSSPLGCCAR